MAWIFAWLKDKCTVTIFKRDGYNFNACMQNRCNRRLKDFQL